MAAAWVVPEGVSPEQQVCPEGDTRCAWCRPVRLADGTLQRPAGCEVEGAVSQEVPPPPIVFLDEGPPEPDFPGAYPLDEPPAGASPLEAGPGAQPREAGLSQDPQAEAPPPEEPAPPPSHYGPDVSGSGDYGVVPQLPGVRVGGPSLGSCSGGEEAVIMLAVALAALPVVLYVVDEPGSPGAHRDWARLNGNLETWTGVLSGGSPMLGMRTVLRQGWIGAEASLEADPAFEWRRDLQVAALLTLPPSRHIDLAFSVGWREVMAPGVQRRGIVVAVPHRYVLGQDGRGLGFDLRPSLFFGDGGVDARIDLAMVVPVFRSLGLEFGVTAATLDEETRTGIFLGLNVSP